MRDTTEPTDDTTAPTAPTDEAQPTTAELQATCEQLHAAIKALGFEVNYDTGSLSTAQPSLRVDALGQLLIAKGIVTQDEWNHVYFSLAASLMGQVLQRLEEQRATVRQAQAQVQPVRPGILVPSHHQRGPIQRKRQD